MAFLHTPILVVQFTNWLDLLDLIDWCLHGVQIDISCVLKSNIWKLLISPPSLQDTVNA